MAEPHKDTSGNYEGALSSLIANDAGELNVHSPATAAVSHPWLRKLTPVLEKLEATHHVGNFVAVQRGPNPEKVWESMPIYVRLGMQLLYHGKEQERLLSGKRVNEYLKEQSTKQGKAFDSEEGAFKHIQDFVKTYQIDCAELLKPNIADYKTFNEFFYRALRPGARPVAEESNAAIISSAADCRLTVFETVDAAKEFWIKGRNFTVANLIQDDELAKGFEGGEVAIFRLAPADYHRFHSAVDCVVGPTKHIPGDYFTVNPVAVNEELDVFTDNKRDVTLLSVPSATGSTPLDLAFVQIGAMLVGSIVQTAKQGDTVKRGDELGYFAYGGSTCILLIPPGKVQWDSDLVENSKAKLETAVRVGDRIGTFV